MQHRKTPVHESIYVIGAGFSAGLGYPLTSNLLVRLWGVLDVHLQEQLTRVIAFHHPGFTPDTFTSFPNVEQLLSEMLVNEELFHASRQYEGKFTKETLRRLQRDLLLSITDWFHELSKRVKPNNPEATWLRTFRERVRKENAAIISFNWDLILDELLFGSELDKASYGFTRPLGGTPVLLKPHGSLNWFEHEQGQHLVGSKRILLHRTKRPRGGGNAIYAFREFRAPVSSAGRRYTPLIVPPIHLKRFEKPVFRALWRNCTSLLSTAKTVTFLGYSMPSADLHAQFIIRCGFNNQVQGELLEGGRAKPTGAAIVTIVNPDGAAAKRIAQVVGPDSPCKWISTPAAEWLTTRA